MRHSASMSFNAPYNGNIAFTSESETMESKQYCQGNYSVSSKEMSAKKFYFNLNMWNDMDLSNTITGS